MLLLAAPALTQDLPGLALPGMQNATPTAVAQSFGSDVLTPRAAAATSVDASALLGLADPPQRHALSLDQVLQLAGEGAAELRIAAERIVQQEANLRRAWAALLPNVNLGGAWQLVCSGGSSDVSCADRATALVDPDQLQQQADLLAALSEVFTTAADASSDAEQAAQLRAQAAQLAEGAASAQQQAQGAKPVVVQPANVFSSTLTMSLPLFNGRALSLLWNAQDAVSLADLARDQVRNALLYTATRAFHVAVAAQKLVAIAEHQRESADKHRVATAARVAAQMQPPLSLRRAELEVLRAKQQLHTARSSYDIAIATLGLMLGREEAFDVVVPTTTSLAHDEADFASELSQEALAARPDVAAQRRALDIARRGELDASMMFLPSVNLVASARATSFTQGFVRDPITGTLAITATLPLYDGGLRYAALKESSSRIREELIRSRQLEDRVRAQILGNGREIVVKRDALALSEESVAVARSARAQAQAMFAAGVGTALDVSDTALALFLAENDLARAQLDLQLARTGFAYVTGASAKAPGPGLTHPRP